MENVKTIVLIELSTYGGSILPEVGVVETGWVVKVIYQDKSSRSDPFTSREGAIRFIAHLATREADNGRTVKVTFDA